MSEKKPSKPYEILQNEQKIKKLQEMHSQVMGRLSKIKDMKLFRVEHSKVLDIQQKIHELRVKNANIQSGKPPNGYSDWYDGYKIID